MVVGSVGLSADSAQARRVTEVGDTAQPIIQVQMDPERPHVPSLQSGIRGLLTQSEGLRE